MEVSSEGASSILISIIEKESRDLEENIFHENSKKWLEGSRTICDFKNFVPKEVVDKYLVMISHAFFNNLQIKAEVQTSIFGNEDGENGAVRDVVTEHFLKTLKYISSQSDINYLHRFSLPLLLSWFTSLHITMDWHLIQTLIHKFVHDDSITISIDWLWCMKEHGLISIDSYLLNHNPSCNETKIKELSNELIQLWKPNPLIQDNIKSLRNKIVISLVSSAFWSPKLRITEALSCTSNDSTHPSSSWPSTGKEHPNSTYSMMLKYLIVFFTSHCQRQNQDTTENTAIEITQVIITSNLPNETIRQCFRFVIKTLIMQPSDINRNEILEDQASSKLKNSEENRALTDLMKNLLIPFSLWEVSELLQDIVNVIIQSSISDKTTTKSALDWKLLTILISVFTKYFENSSCSLISIVEKLIVTSLDADQFGQITFETAMIIVRQACQESRAGPLQTYGLWFAQTFGDETTSLTANSKQRIIHLVQYLTNMVPHETSACLRAHLARPPWIPSNSRELWNDYSTLSRTRLRDFNANKNIEWNSVDQPIFTSIKPSFDIYDEKGCKRLKHEHGENEENPVLSDVEKALQSFDMNKKMPQVVLEASIFRRPYFIGQFLPALLTLSLNYHTSNYTAHDKQIIKEFTQCLQAKGKIPPQMLNHFEKYIN